MAALSIVITFPFALGVPGGGTLDCMETARHLSLAGAKVALLPVITNSHSRFPRPPLLAEQAGAAQEAELRASMVHVSGVARSRYHYLLDGLAVRNAIARLLDQRHVDAVVSYWQEAVYLPPLLRGRGVLFSMIAGAPYRLWFANRPHQRLLGERENARTKLRQVAKRVYAPIRNRARHYKARLVVGNSLRSADLVFARSRFTGQEVVDIFGVDAERVTVSHCGVDPAFSRVVRLPSDKITHLFYFGALIPDKGIFDAIEALGKLASRGPRDWTFKVAGWGDEAGVRSAARARGIAEHVVLLGRLDRSALLRELAWAHLAVLPSRAESFGLAIAEAQAAGLPVVACDVGAVPEVVGKDTTAWLVPAGDVDLLTRRITEAMDNPGRTVGMGLAGRERVTKLFRWERTATGILENVEGYIAKTSRSRKSIGV